MRSAPLAGVALLLARTHGISVEGSHKHSPDDIDEDDFLWEKLPGRCCFLIHEECPFEKAPRELCTKTSASSCEECDVWSEPDNFCHTSAEACDTCSMELYCPAPPPLVAGNKVCTGTSRVGQGCFDELQTGVCASHTMADCQDACRKNNNCDVFVYYQEEAKGSCVLCADLLSSEPTPGAATRAYVITPAAPPPSALGNSVDRKYSIVAESPPPSPPRAPPKPLSAGVETSQLGRTHKTKTVECDYKEGVEFTVDVSTGYTDRTAAGKDECCRLCGERQGCTEFVFEPSTGTCVLLPEAELAQIEERPNLFVISGSVRISAVKKVVDQANCKFREGSAFAGSILGPGMPIPGGEMKSMADCCESCGRAVQCTKFTFDEGSRRCTLHASTAEMYMVSGRVSGTIAGKGVSFAGGDGEEAAYPPPPSGPAFTTLHQSPPPPPIELNDSGRAQDVIAYVSFGVIALLVVMFTLCAFFFFSPQLRALAHRLGRRDVKYGLASGEMDPMMASARDGKRKKKRGAKAGLAKVIVQTASLTQSKDMDVSCEGLDELVQKIFEEFSHMVKELRPAQTVLLCKTISSEQDEDDDEEESASADQWLLVEEETDIAQALAQCKTFKLLEQRRAAARSTYRIAFPANLSERLAACAKTAGDEAVNGGAAHKPKKKGKKDSDGRKRGSRKSKSQGGAGDSDEDSDGGTSMCSAATASRLLPKSTAGGRPRWESAEDKPALPIDNDPSTPLNAPTRAPQLETANSGSGSVQAAPESGWHDDGEPGTHLSREMLARTRVPTFVPDDDML